MITLSQQAREEIMDANITVYVFTVFYRLGQN